MTIAPVFEFSLLLLGTVIGVGIALAQNLSPLNRTLWAWLLVSIFAVIATGYIRSLETDCSFVEVLNISRYCGPSLLRSIYPLFLSVFSASLFALLTSFFNVLRGTFRRAP